MNARLVYFMGPSGAGKDSLLDWLRARLPAAPGVHWAQRTISRSAAPGGEAHESVSPQAFAALRSAQAFALHWQANGLDYGVRHAQLTPPLAAGQWVLLNGSRAHLSAALARFPQLLAVHITASPALLRQRLLARGRESAEAIDARVQRALRFAPPSGSAGIELHNDCALDEAGQRLLSALARCPGWPVEGLLT